jgi:TolB-like protein
LPKPANISNTNLPSKKEILDQLEEVLKSQYFAYSRILKAFLDFVVKKTVEDRAVEIKEYSIGLQILDRKEGYNPQKDASVRIHAVRLRKILEKYYSEEGKRDSVVIEIPKGKYFARFRYAGSAHNEILEEFHPNVDSGTTGAIDKPLVAIMPFITYSDKDLEQLITDGIGEKLCAELSHYEDISVLSYYSTAMCDSEKWGFNKIVQEFKASHLITGSINYFGNNILVSYELVGTKDFKIIWAESIEQPVNSHIYHDLKLIATRIASVLGGYNGIIQIHNNSRKAPAEFLDSQAVNAVFWFYHYHIRYTEDIFQEAVRQLQKSVELFPNYALAHALLGLLYTDSLIFGFSDTPDELEKAMIHTGKALQIDPSCQQAYLSRAWVQAITGKQEEAEFSMEHCLSINPNSPFFIASCGLGMALIGKYERSHELVQKVKSLSPTLRWWIHVPDILYNIHKMDLEQALRHAESINFQGGIFHRAFEISIHSLLGRRNEVRKLADEYLKLYPSGIDTIYNSVGLMISDKKVCDALRQGFVLSGLVSKTKKEVNDHEKS